MCLAQVHSSHSACDFEACFFFQLTLEYMDFLRSLIFWGDVNNDHTKFKMVSTIANDGGQGGWGEQIPKEHFVCWNVFCLKLDAKYAFF